MKIVMEEVNALNKLDHPSIVKYFETYNDVNFIYLIMEFVEGQPLSTKITSQPAQHFSEQKACLYMT